MRKDDNGLDGRFCVVESTSLGLDLSRRSFGSFRHWQPGAETRPLPTRAGAAGVLICNELLLPQLARKHVRDGAGFLVNQANDGWLASGWTPWQTA